MPVHCSLSAGVTSEKANVDMQSSVNLPEYQNDSGFLIFGRDGPR